MLDQRPQVELDRAARLETAGRHAEAAAAWRGIVALDPSRAESHFRLGLLLQAARRPEDAIAAFGQVLALAPDHGAAWHRLGLALLDGNRFAEAIAAQRNAVRLRPDDPAGHLGLGDALRLSGRPADAITCYQTVLALRRDDADAELQRAHALAALGRADEAVIGYCAAIGLRPDHAPSHYSLAVLLQQAGMLEHAIRSYVAAAALKSDFAEAHVNRGNCLLALGRPDLAIAAYEAALHIWPGYPIAHANLGCALERLGRFEEAAARQDAALRLKPDYPEAHSNLGTALLAQGKFPQAIAAFRAALRLRPDYAEAHANLGAALRDIGDIAGALLACETAIELQPGRPAPQFNHALALLTAGRYEEGWAAHERRFELPTYPRRELGRPQWRGEALAGARILLHAEQGLGDTLQFVRYAPLVAARGAQVILEVQAPLVRLLGRMPGVAQVVACGETLPEFDLHCPLMSLPHAFGTRLNTVPAETPYLHPDPALVTSWGLRLPVTGEKRIGLVWAGSARANEPRNHFADRRRSLQLRTLAPLAAVPGARFISLQLGAPAAQAAAPPPGLPLCDPTGGIRDFDDTAALVANLDLVVAVDTSVAHLAAALGKPVWLLSRSDACWRWLINRDDSPWYPTLRLYRQEQPATWQPTIARLAADLAHFTRC